MYDWIALSISPPVLAKGKSFSYKKQLFQSYFIANSSYLVGNVHYRNWGEWIKDQMMKLGREVEETEPQCSVQSIEEVIDSISSFNQNIDL